MSAHRADLVPGGHVAGLGRVVCRGAGLSLPLDVPDPASRRRLVVMDLMDADVRLVTETGIEIPATADVRDWYPPGTERPAGSPVWSAMVSAGVHLPDLMPVGSLGELHVDESGAHATYVVAAVHVHAAEVRGRSTITP